MAQLFWQETRVLMIWAQHTRSIQDIGFNKRASFRYDGQPVAIKREDVAISGSQGETGAAHGIKRLQMVGRYPQTGDENGIRQWMFVMCLAGSGIILSKKIRKLCL